MRPGHLIKSSIGGWDQDQDHYIDVDGREVEGALWCEWGSTERPFCRVRAGETHERKGKPPETKGHPQGMELQDI